MPLAISARSCPSPPEAGAQALERCVSTSLVRALADLLQQRGIAREALFGHRADALLSEPVHRSLPLSEFQALLSRAIELTNEPALGLSCGLHAADASFGLMAPLVAHAPTLRKALALVCQFQSLFLHGIHVRLHQHIGKAELRYEHVHPNTVDRSVAELLVAGLLRTLLSFGCTRREILCVRFAHSRPAYYPSYTVAFSGVERFSQPSTSIEFCAHALDRPHLHHHAELEQLLLAQAERNLQQLSRPLSCAARVRAFIHDWPASRLPDMIAAAHELSISTRSLRRRLQDEGTSYRALANARLHELACSMLRDPDTTLIDIAHDLGFADARTFQRAFRRWADVGPSEYRAAIHRTGLSRQDLASRTIAHE